MIRSVRRVFPALAFLTVPLFGCERDPKRVAQPLTVVASDETYGSRCAPCHGMDGRGAGALAATISPKPRDFSDAAFQTGITDDQLRNVILRGGGAVGKSVTMPASSDLASKPEIVDGLVAKVRSFRK